jgi:hypothetical protein
MDVWRILLAIAQVAAAAAENEIMFNKVESAPMARFHSIGQVFLDALYGHIIIMFDVALLRLHIKELQEGISYRQNRATPKHRDLYDVLEENLAGRSWRVTWTSSQHRNGRRERSASGLLAYWAYGM